MCYRPVVAFGKEHGQDFLYIERPEIPSLGEARWLLTIYIIYTFII